jgi:hypothetical protein
VRGACASWHHGEHDARASAANGGRGRAGVVAVLAVRVQQGFDHGDVYRARAANGACLGVYWCGVECACARREGEEDRRDVAMQSTGASSGVPVHALAHPGVVITLRSRLWRHPLDLGSCPADSA